MRPPHVDCDRRTSWAPRSCWTRSSLAAAIAAPKRSEPENRAGRGLNVSSSQSARARVNPQCLGRRKSTGLERYLGTFGKIVGFASGCSNGLLLSRRTSSPPMMCSK
ncbi:hypothetical protein HPB49_017336 [Dermacentor silvarum]|uniref:Uncharacterized protein n=1 Tax=Dermacentor silvarum TaxID=543639 RepID=A0ACB8C4R4_DERSI|nr:hypothetical protein HPB49_017336 [Dermacentor silvarum]